VSDADLLAQIPLFESLAPSDCEALAATLNTRSFGKGDTVFASGDIGSSLYVVRSGKVRIFLPRRPGSDEVLLKLSAAGAYFGELSLFDDKPRSASVQALEDTVLLELTREALVQHLAEVPHAAFAILAEMSERLRETNQLLSQRATKDVVKELDDRLTWREKLADKVAELNGSWAFILVLLIGSLAWALVNLALPHPFDRYPYVFFNLLLAILVALQGPLIVMSQNRQSRKDRAQAETDYRVNLKNEVGIETLQRELVLFRETTERELRVLRKAIATPDSQEPRKSVPPKP
jgi:CRP/FNR family transcriptional regulator, cyclic AMP receptor protein